MKTAHGVYVREQIVVNTDPQRRCYNGANFSEAKVWSAWKFVVANGNMATAEDHCKVFKRINPKREYEIRPVCDVHWNDKCAICAKE